MAQLNASARQGSAGGHPPFTPSLYMPEVKSDAPGIWDWSPQQEAILEAAAERNAPLQAKRPLGGSEGIPDTQPDTDDLLNTALAVITGIGLVVIISSLVRRITER
ncbi:MAG: hypothetical protein QM647_03145 [Asticcacaulis sp.]|uniref:hypothetical protein n=1 Tax=Asticcacaulis sp. TaxID=1872648 RepID=UPI0039E46F2F